MAQSMPHLLNAIQGQGNAMTMSTINNFESVDTFIDLVTMVYSHLFLRVVTYL